MDQDTEIQAGDWCQDCYAWFRVAEVHEKTVLPEGDRARAGYVPREFLIDHRSQCGPFKVGDRLTVPDREDIESAIVEHIEGDRIKFVALSVNRLAENLELVEPCESIELRRVVLRELREAVDASCPMPDPDRTPPSEPKAEGVPVPTIEPDRRVPQRFEYRDRLNGSRRFGVCFPVVFDGAPWWTFKTQGGSFSSFEGDPSETIRQCLRDVSGFKWLDNDEGWPDQDQLNSVTDFQQENSMLRVALYVSTGELVTYVIVPNFKPMPEVILWGSRAFVRRPDGKYFEGMLYPAFTEEEMKCQGREIREDAITPY